MSEFLTPKKIVTLVSLVVILALGLIFKPFAYEKIDTGHEGIKVSLYGDSKGVDNISLVTGIVWYNPYTTKVHEYPTFVQTYDYAPFTMTSKDGSVFTVDPSISIGILEGATPRIFKKYRQNIISVLETTMYNHVRDVYRIEFNKYTTDQILSSREKFEEGIQVKMNNILTKEGFYMDQLTSGIVPPTSIIKAIDAKNKAVQDAQRVENELRVVEADARKLVVQAEAEAEANRLRQVTLTPLLIQQQAIERWNGELPSSYSGSSMPFIKTF